MSTMKAAVIEDYVKSLADIQVADLPVPTLRPGYVLVKVPYPLLYFTPGTSLRSLPMLCCV